MAFWVIVTLILVGRDHVIIFFGLFPLQPKKKTIVWIVCVQASKQASKAHFRQGSKVQFPREPIWADLKQIESLSWTLSWSLAWFLVLQIRSFPFSNVFGSKPIDFPFKTGAM